MEHIGQIEIAQYLQACVLRVARVDDYRQGEAFRELELGDEALVLEEAFLIRLCPVVVQPLSHNTQKGVKQNYEP